MADYLIHGTLTAVFVVALVFLPAGQCIMFSNDWTSWTGWTSCSDACGNSGIQSRSRDNNCGLFCSEDSQTQSQGCNRFCYNGGSMQPGYCSCTAGYKGTCCQTQKQCGNPGTVAFGIISGNTWSYGGVVTYQCDTNYQLAGGDTSRTCGGNEYWSGTPPTCTFACPCVNGGCSQQANPFTCVCPLGYYGQLCENKVVCPNAASINHGVLLGSDFTFGASVTYQCNADYEAVGGVTTMTCQVSATDVTVGVWSGIPPTCSFINSCGSSPCKNGASCTNGYDVYTCTCASGYSGPDCGLDVQPPVVTGCPSDITRYVTTPEVVVDWTSPNIYDPHGLPVTLSTNYPEDGGSFTWGEYQVAYTGVKPANGLQASCLFNVNVYPNQCGEFPAPLNGAIACNGWNERFGAVCAVFCTDPYSPELGVDVQQLLVCGAQGIWTPSYGSFSCSANRDTRNEQPGYADHFYPGSCGSQPGEAFIRAAYLRILGSSAYSELCNLWPEVCAAEQVTVTCGSTP